MMNQSVKKSHLRKNVLEEKRKILKRKICIKKTNTFTIIAINFLQEQLKKQDLEMIRNDITEKHLEKTIDEKNKKTENYS